ncbi:hypothetical protein CDAR_4531 [Caerostris darwini]|uniref:Uncharacterized protein n=1 Tax=Caerostris darwini TaxID=1538125 RepID=A0AAV4SJZ2_9ARAC|nr:hypothetical protein CDAR_4531 [Caerostris darwini]
MGLHCESQAIIIVEFKRRNFTTNPEVERGVGRRVDKDGLKLVDAGRRVLQFPPMSFRVEGILDNPTDMWALVKRWGEGKHLKVGGQRVREVGVKIHPHDVP